MGWQVLALYSGGELFWHESCAGTLQPSLLLVLIFARSKNSLHVYLVSNTDTAASSSPKKITDLLYTIVVFIARL